MHGPMPRTGDVYGTDGRNAETPTAGCSVLNQR